MKDYKKLKNIFILILVLGIVTGIGYYSYKYFTKLKKDTKELENDIVDLDDNKDGILGIADSSIKENPKVVEKIMVDIKGEVNNPGAYLIEKDKRIIDVITIAGGITSNADTSMINLSKKVFDEMTIIIYSREQIINITTIKQQEAKIDELCNSEVVNDACIKDKDDNSTQKISINTATKEQLMTLSGIGDAKAEDIINYRITNGEFKKIEDLMLVSGIGESLFAKIKENITI